MSQTHLTLTPVDGPTSLKDHAYRRIKDAILTLQLTPGAPLVEAELAEQLGISKTPVRDALLELRREGLVTKIPYSGTFVSEITATDICEIVQVRAVLEGRAAYFATPGLNDDELKHLGDLIAKELEALAAGQVERASQCNAAFHHVILSKVSNRRLVTLVENFEDQMRRIRARSIQLSGRLKKSAEEHSRVLEALRARDAARAEEQFRIHILSVLDDLTAEGTQIATTNAPLAPIHPALAASQDISHKEAE